MGHHHRLDLVSHRTHPVSQPLHPSTAFCHRHLESLEHAFGQAVEHAAVLWQNCCWMDRAPRPVLWVRLRHQGDTGESVQGPHDQLIWHLRHQFLLLCHLSQAVSGSGPTNRHGSRLPDDHRALCLQNRRRSRPVPVDRNRRQRPPYASADGRRYILLLRRCRQQPFLLREHLGFHVSRLCLIIRRQTKCVVLTSVFPFAQYFLRRPCPGLVLRGCDAMDHQKVRMGLLQEFWHQRC